MKDRPVSGRVGLRCYEALACIIHEGAGVGRFWAVLADRRAVSGMADLPCRKPTLPAFLLSAG